LNFSKSGIVFSFGVPGARIGVNTKGEETHPGRHPRHRAVLPVELAGCCAQFTASVSPLGILIVVPLIGHGAADSR
jgi:uncharacterized protein DUF4236